MCLWDSRDMAQLWGVVQSEPSWAPSILLSLMGQRCSPQWPACLSLPGTCPILGLKCNIPGSSSVLSKIGRYGHPAFAKFLISHTLCPLWPSAAMLKTQVPSLGGEDTLGEEMASHFSTLAWRIPMTKEPGGLQSMGSQKVGLDWVTNSNVFIYLYPLICWWTQIASMSWLL